MSLWLGHIWGAAGVVSAITILSLPGILVMYIQIKKILNNTANGIWIK
jgi:hypothetical protein